MHIALAVKDGMRENVSSFLVREFICAKCKDTYELVINQEQFDREKKTGNRPKLNKKDRNSDGLDFSLHGLLPVSASDVTKITRSSLSIIRSRSLAFLFRTSSHH